MRCLAALAVLAALSVPAAAQDVTIRFIANEGVHISDGETGVLIDALTWNSYDGNYALPSDEARAAMIAGDPPYDDVVALLFTHIHGDHFDPEGAVAASQRDIPVVGSVQIVDAFRANGGDEFEAHTLEVSEDDCERNDADCWADMFGGTIWFFSSDEEFERPLSVLERRNLMDDLYTTGIQVDARPLFHRQGVDHWTYRIAIGGVSILHLGDTAPQMADFAVWDGTEFDVILYPYWFAQMPAGAAFLDSRPESRAIAFHIPAAATPQTIRAGLGEREYLFGEGSEVVISAHD